MRTQHLIKSGMITGNLSIKIENIIFKLFMENADQNVDILYLKIENITFLQYTDSLN